MTDTEILSLLYQRQETALEQLRAQYEGLCMSIANRILPCHEDVEEVVSDVWLKLWEKPPQEPPRSLCAYVGAMARNLALDRYRHIHSERRGGGEVPLVLEELRDIVSDCDQTCARLQTQDLAKGINRFLSLLSQRDRSIFLRRYFYLETDQEIADRYGLHASSVRTVISRSRKKMKTYLKKEGYL